MEDFLASCVERYLELAGPGTKMRTVSTPFLADDQNLLLVRKPLHPGPCIACPWCKRTVKYSKSHGTTAIATPARAGNSTDGDIQPSMSDVGKCITPDD
eukprot:4180795-Heterocapsa_arctica.AAC.1